MANDILTGKWNEAKGDMKKWWGKLTDDDWDEVKGDSQKLYGKLQERYGWDKLRAETEVRNRFNEYEREHAHTTTTKTY